MLNYLRLSTLFFCINSPLHAGFYLGTLVGPEGANFTQRAYVTRPNTFVAIDKNHFAGTGLFASILAGYNKRYQNYYWAGEANLAISSVEHRLSNDEFVHFTFSKTRFTVRHNEGISFLPGYYLADNMILYGRIGYANGHLKIRESDPTIKSMKKDRSGIRYGLGMKYFFSSQYALVMDYTQINYKNVKSWVYEPFGMVTKATKISPDTAQLGLGINYYFDQPSAVFVK